MTPEDAVLGEKVKQDLTEFLAPSTEYLVKKRLRPNYITVAGFMLSLVAAFFFASTYEAPYKFRLAGFFVLLAGLCDIFDGQVARAGRTGTKFGALLDSTADRYAEIFVYFGIAVDFVRSAWWGTSAALFFAMAGSLMVSYVRARAEGLGEECKVGFMQRPERVIAIGVSALLGREALAVVMCIVAVLANYTVLERMWHLRKI
jgi:CDP-diacylglycerol--glycerol-3-phosphate 3-phosphatidyltransferase